MRPLPAVFSLALLAVPAAAVPAELPSIDKPLKTGLSAKSDAAVVVGVEDYAYLPDAQYAERDAEAMYQFLIYTRGIPSSRVTLLKGGTSRSKIMDAVSEAGGRAGPGSTVWVYFAGHGAADPSSRQRILLPANTLAEEEGFSESGMRVSDLQAMAGSGGGEVVMMTDACFTGAGRTGESLLSSGRAFTPAKATVVGRAVGWDAVQANEVARPLDSVQHGAFTYFAIGALRGWADGEVSGTPDGNVTADEAQLYVSNALKAVGMRDQSPSLVGASVESRVLSSGATDKAPELSALTVVSRPDPPRPVPPSGGGTSGTQFDVVVNVDAESLLKEQECATDLEKQANASHAAKLSAAVLAVQTGAAGAWSKLSAQSQTCLKLTDLPARESCAKAVDTFVKTASGASASIETSVESVTTACGARSKAFAAESVAVSVASLSEAKSVAAQLRVVPVAPKATPAASAVVSPASSSGRDWTSPTLGLMKWIPAGTFTMGSPTSESGRDDDEVQHKVTLTKGYWMMEHEVTQGEWASVMGSNPSVFTPCGSKCPVEQVSWHDAVSFAKKVSSRDGVQYRLPTEAEWEYAARGGASTTYAGGNELGSLGWYKNNGESMTHPGCQKARNAFGLCDMSGNVWEWVSDGYGTYPSGSATDPSGAGLGSARVYRGGSWDLSPADARAANRSRLTPHYDEINLGFRLVRASP